MKKIHKILIILLVGVIFFLIFNYKKIFCGNTINIKSKQEIIEKILNGNVNYKAEMIVKIISNKNENIYEVIQEENNIKSYQEVVSKGDIEGIKIIYTDDVLKVENTDLKLEKIYKDYEPIMSNYLFLSDFSEDYLKSDETSVTETETDIVINLKIENSNKYIKYKELYINKKTGLPIKMIIKDSDKQVRVCIEYTNIEIL